MDTTPDLTFYFAIHRKMRADIDRCAVAVATATEADRAGRLRPLVRWVRGFGHELAEHHHVEDRFLFPELRRRVPAAGSVLDALEEDHEVMDALLARWPGAIRALADPSAPFASAHAEAHEVTQGLADLLGPHLEREDADVLPLFWRHLTGDEYAALQATAVKKGKKSGLGFVVPWNASAVEGEARAALVGSAPPPMRLILRATEGRHRRLVGAAFPDDLRSGVLA